MPRGLLPEAPSSSFIFPLLIHLLRVNILSCCPVSAYPASGLVGGQATVAQFPPSVSFACLWVDHGPLRALSFNLLAQLPKMTAPSCTDMPRDSYVSRSCRSLTSVACATHHPALSIPTADTQVPLTLRPSNFLLCVLKSFRNTPWFYSIFLPSFHTFLNSGKVAELHKCYRNWATVSD